LQWKRTVPENMQILWARSAPQPGRHVPAAALRSA
jgi:hypothetical protein